MTKSPVEVMVRRDGDRYFAECPELHIFSGGDSPEEARQCLDEQVIYFYQRYINLPEDEVTGLAAELRALYMKRFSISHE